MTTADAPAETEVAVERSSHRPRVAVDRMEEIAYDPYSERRRRAYKVLETIYVLFGLIEALIAIRVVLRALGANPSAGFAQFIYGVTAPLLAPFVGLFADPQVGDGVIELHALTALFVYALLAWLIGKLFWLLLGETRSVVKTVIRSVDTHIAP